MKDERSRCRALAQAYTRIAIDSAKEERPGSIERAYYEGAAWAAGLVAAEIDFPQDDEEETVQ